MDSENPITLRLTLLPDGPVGLDPERLTVTFFDGKLSPAHARLLKGDRPALLCALRESGQPSEWELELLSSLVSGRPFNPPDTAWIHLQIGSMGGIGTAADAASALASEVGASATVSKLASDVTHELLANALLAAPVDEAGVARYATRRDASPEISAEDACTFSLGTHAKRIYLVATDRFGRLTTGPVVRAVEGYGGKVQPDTSGGGAGLGTRLILEHCDAIAFRVIPGQSTEAVGVIELDGPRRRAGQPKSLFFFQSAIDARGGQRVR
ncbi:MAG: hypothetical protein M3Y59_00165 [Myxococcota bacterium]|nr:hypothetical protein [Myxococcota bacterium]